MSFERESFQQNDPWYSIDEAAGFLAQPGQDARLGNEDGID
jgi:hypothetical protein